MIHGASKSLITFAFVKDEFDRTGDIVRGLIPLFAPIFEQLAGKNFSSVEFAAAVKTFYGLKMHPWVAEDWAPRFEEAGLLVGSGDKYTRSYVCASPPGPSQSNGTEVVEMLDNLITHIADRVRHHGLIISDSKIESAVISRLSKPDFLNLLLKPDVARATGQTLVLPRNRSPTSVDPEAVLDFLLASRIIELGASNTRQFDLISKVASGALVSEIVLNLRNPPKVGQKVASGCVIYLDSPFVIDLLDLADKRQHIYATDLVKDLKDSGAYLRTFTHNLSEIRAIMSATIEGSNSVNSSVGTVAYRARTDGNARTRLQATRANLEKKVRDVGITTVDLETVTKDNYKFFPEDFVIDLTGQIRPFSDIFSREVDARSIAGVARTVLSKKPVANIMSLPAMFITKNSGLARAGNRALKESCNYPEDAAQPFLTDRQAAGLMWLALGGTAGNLPTRQLLANCANVVSPRRDVLSAVFRLLEDTDPKSAAEFEALMTEDRCAHYVMESALGDAALVTADNAVEILAEVKRRAVEDTTAQIERQKQAEIQSQREAHAAQVNELGNRHFDEITRIRAAQEADRLKMQEAAQLKDQEVAESRIALALQQEEASQNQVALVAAEAAITQLQKSTILSALKKAKHAGTAWRLAISLGITVTLAAIGLAGLYFSQVIKDEKLIMYITAAVLIAVTILSGLTCWIIPELIFKRFVDKRVSKLFEAEISALGAESYLTNWNVDLTRYSINPRPSSAPR